MKEVAFVLVFLVVWYGGLILAGVKPPEGLVFTDGVNCCAGFWDRLISTEGGEV